MRFRLGIRNDEATLGFSEREVFAKEIIVGGRMLWNYAFVLVLCIAFFCLGSNS